MGRMVLLEVILLKILMMHIFHSNQFFSHFTHAPESHGYKPVDEWILVRGFALRSHGFTAVELHMSYKKDYARRKEKT